MALKPFRDTIESVILYHTSAVAEKGGIASDPTADAVSYAANPSGAAPIGVLMQDVVELAAGPVTGTISVTEPLQNSDTKLGDKVELLSKGTVETNLISGTAPAQGDDAYLAASGYVSADIAAGAPKVGKFLSAKDADGYALVKIEL
jgi:hypothetical protein